MSRSRQKITPTTWETCSQTVESWLGASAARFGWRRRRQGRRNHSISTFFCRLFGASGPPSDQFCQLDAVLHVRPAVPCNRDLGMCRLDDSADGTQGDASHFEIQCGAGGDFLPFKQDCIDIDYCARNPCGVHNQCFDGAPRSVMVGVQESEATNVYVSRWNENFQTAVGVGGAFTCHADNSSGPCKCKWLSAIPLESSWTSTSSVMGSWLMEALTVMTPVLGSVAAPAAWITRQANKCGNLLWRQHLCEQ